MIAFGKPTGYEIKAFMDKTTRYFWAASYGQIYPELRQLEERGLVRGRSEPSGGRARTVYELTERGRDALEEWLGSRQEPLYELRDEGMLKLFFSDASPARRRENIRSMRRRHEAKLAQLRALEPAAAGGPPGPALTLELGIAMTESLIGWCARAEAQMAGDGEG